MPKKHDGFLDFHGDNQNHGIVWILKEDGKRGYQTIDHGDHLVIYNDNKSVLFSDIIKPDYQTGRSQKHGQQEALGWWVHWIQKGWQPDDWAMLFTRHLRAMLIKL